MSSPAAPASGTGGELGMSPVEGAKGGTSGRSETSGSHAEASGAGAGGMSGVPAALSSGAGTSGAMSGPPPCPEPGALRCVPDGKGKREQCSDGMWVEAAACAAGEVCAGMDTTKPGSCLLVAAVCAGNEGKAVCDGEGTLYQCDANAVIERQESCGSAELCKPGITSGKCAKCVPGKHRCTGKQLERCDEGGEAFGPDTPCVNEALCDAEAGKCNAPACEAGQWVCRGDELQRCNEQQTELVRQTNCGPGLCSAEMHACVECASDSQCADRASGCQEGSCRGNMCTTTPARDGKACGGSATCRGGACCTPNCRNKCGGASDGCGGTCDAVCPPRCGNGIVEGDELCDGNCPTSCPDDGNDCTRDVPRGLPCKIECKHEVIETGVKNKCGGCGALRYMGMTVPDTVMTGVYCSVGMGSCFATGTIDCLSRPGNMLGCTARGASPRPEVCDGADEDCDGIGDNNGADASCGPGMRCASGYGRCEPIPP